LRSPRILLLLFLVLPGRGWTDSLDVTSGLALSLPMAVVTADGGPFRWVESLNVTADYPVPFLPFLFLEGTGSFDRLHLVDLSQSSVSTAGAAAGAGITLGLGGRLRINVAADAGYLAAIYNEAVSTTWFIQAHSTLLLSVNPSFAFGVGVLYKMINGLYEGAGVSVSITQSVPIEAMGD
jgi:hypothetical protein